MSSSSDASFTFSDLFAGIGGFHAALHAAGGRWAFASEIDPDASRVYDHNWLRPLREAGAPLPDGVESFEVSGDIVDLTDPAVKVPHSDVLAAGFPCQPFSKSGFQRGMDETRGTLFWNIARILQDPDRRPSVVLLENVRNLAGPRHRDTTFRTIVTTLRQLGYRTASEPAVFSPHLLPPELGGRPQVRERVFILAHYVGAEAAQDPVTFDAPIVSPKSLELDWNKDRWDLAKHLPLESDEAVRKEHGDTYDLESSELKWITEWDMLLSRVAARLGAEERLPGFPIWLQHFGDFRTIEGAKSYIRKQERKLGSLPAWKRSHLMKNGEWFERFADVLEPHWQVISGFPASRQKFEWQAGPYRPLAETIMHFRPSGIRCKRPDYVPALVAITQTTVLGERRRLTPRETARLQGLPETFEFMQTPFGAHRGLLDGPPIVQTDPASYKQMGNGVNVGAAYYVFRRYVRKNRREIPQHIVDAVDEAPGNPDEALGTLADG
jgi:DNA (cytosine-5)-methyltransferase 1